MRWLNTKLASEIGELYLGGVITYIEACERIAESLGMLFPHVRHAGTMKKFNEHLEYCIAQALPCTGDGEVKKHMDVQLIFVDAQLVPSGIVVGKSQMSGDQIWWEPASSETYCVDSGMAMSGRYRNCIDHKGRPGEPCYTAKRSPRCCHTANNPIDHPLNTHYKCVDCGRIGRKVQKV